MGRGRQGFENMLGIVYLYLCFTTGYVICAICLPNLDSMVNTSYRGKAINVHKLLLLVPAWYFLGTIIITWMTYIFGYIFRSNDKPLIAANIITMSLALVINVGGFLLIKRNRKRDTIKLNVKTYIKDYIYIALAAILAIVLMFRTFYINGSTLKVGLSVFSDFSPHLLMIRSFSYGNNFPTTYGYYAGEDIRYHFMFQFLAGNLEFLGLRLDYAFNLPSIFSLLSTFSLLYVLAAKITGSKRAALLSGVFFAFRSSPSLFKYIADIPKGSIIETLSYNINFIGETVNEGWGLWNLNVYVNQRHFAFSISIMLFMLIMFLPLFYKQEERIRKYITYIDTELKGVSYICVLIKQCFFVKEAWLSNYKHTAASEEELIINIKTVKKTENIYVKYILLGIILGLSAFFNGSVLICTIMILFFMAAFSDSRLLYLITALIAAVLSLMQSSFFINGSAAIVKFKFGFIASDKTFLGVLEYVVELTGILFIVIFIALILLKAAEKYLILAFSVPFISAFVISLTPDVTVNHKNIMLSIMLLGVFSAWLIDKMLEKKNIFIKFFAVIVVIILTATGIYDFTVVMKRNADFRNISYNLDNEITLWVKENAASQDIFLTHNYYLNELVLGGAMLFDGWQYYAWSAGYDTALRDRKVSNMYRAYSVERLDSLVVENNIRYIVIDYNNRTSTEYMLNEELIKSVYKLVFTSGTGEHSFDIYDTKIKINE